MSLVAISATDGSTLVKNTATQRVTYTNMTNSVQDKTKRCREAGEILMKSQIVCFDVDSTVIKEEGIDELAGYCGKGQEVAKL